MSHVFTKRVQFSHVRVFSDSRNMQKSVALIIYLWPLPSCHHVQHIVAEQQKSPETAVQVSVNAKFA